MTSYFDIEYTDPDGNPKKARTQSVNGLHTEDLLREHFATHNVFGTGAVINKVTKVTDSAQIAAMQASRPPLPEQATNATAGHNAAGIIKQIQNAENAANPPTAGQPAAEAFPAAPNTLQPAPAQA